MSDPKVNFSLGVSLEELPLLDGYGRLVLMGLILRVLTLLVRMGITIALRISVAMKGMEITMTTRHKI